MSLSTEITATHLVAQYLWSLMKSDLGYNAADYSSIAPFSVAGQQQELASFTKPFVIMGWSFQPVDNWLLEREIASFTIFANDITDVNDFINLAVNKLKRLDDAAAAVNKWLSTASQTNTSLNVFKKFDIKSIQFRSATGPQPPMQEGGRHDGNIVVSILYSDLTD